MQGIEDTSRLLSTLKSCKGLMEEKKIALIIQLIT